MINNGPPRHGRAYGALRRVRLGLPLLLARIRRAATQPKLVIGVTGSVGKGAVTRLVGRILESDGSTYCAVGGNTYGAIRRRFLKSPSRAVYWVQEISGHEPGEVARSAQFVQPQIGVLTCIGQDHVKNFESPEALAMGKGDLFAALPSTGTAVVNADDPAALDQSLRAPCRVLTFGYSEDADLRIGSVSGGFPAPLSVRLMYGGHQTEIATQFFGERWAIHLAAAVATGISAGYTLEQAASRLLCAQPDLYRDSVHAFDDGTTFVLDCAKASFWTIESSFKLLSTAEARKKVVVLGTLSDYRGTARKRYTEAARSALSVADELLAYGPHAQRLVRLLPEFPERLRLFETYSELAHYLHAASGRDLLVYVKSTRGDHLERLMHQKRGPIKCTADACGVSLRSCNTCKRLYGRRLSTEEAASLR